MDFFEFFIFEVLLLRLFSRIDWNNNNIRLLLKVALHHRNLHAVEI
jgi:hypothetical protein